MKNLLHNAKKLALLAAGLACANVAPAQSLWHGSGNWSTAADWSPAVVPTASTNVVFTNNTGAATAPGSVDNTVDSGFPGTIASLTFQNTNTSGGSGFYHTTQIPAGQTLTVLGGLTVGNMADVANNQIYASFTGTGTLLVSNTTAGVNVSQGDTGNGAQATLNMTNLNTFDANIGGITVGVYNTPNQAVARQKGYLFLARTNNLTISGTQSHAYGNEGQIEIGENLGNGSNIQIPMYLGLVNNINVNTITVCADKQGSGALISFNPVFTNASPTAVFRGAAGTNRVSSWILADNSNQTTTGSGTGTGVCDFSYGTLDAMVDSLTIGKSESGASSGTGSGTGIFTFTAGTNNVNTLYIGYRIASGGNSAGIGTMNVNGTGTLIANNAICLSYWNGGTANVYASGTLNVNGGTVEAATITNGVTQAGSQGFVTANINVTSGTLGITTLQGSIGTTAWPLGIVTLSGATLQMPLNGVQTNLVATALILGGSTNYISISSVPASIISYPYQYPLISYTSLSGFNFGLTNLPGTYQGYISNNTANETIDLVLTGGPTSILSLNWNGNVSGNWDVITPNWLNAVTAADYSDGALVTFNDNATGTTNVNLTGTFSPTTMTLNNTLLPYNFGGSGKIAGVGNLVKSGTGSVLFTNTGANSFIGGISLSAGTLQFGAGGTGGNLPPTGNITNNATLILDQSGTVNSFNSISGAGTIIQSGSGSLNLAGQSSFTGNEIVNTGTLLVNGSIAGTLTNAAGTTIGGSGSNTGPVMVGGALQPSAATTTPTTFTSGNLTLESGAGLTFEMNGPDATVGQGSNDLINVVGNLNANGNTVKVNFVGIPQTSSPYTVMTYSGGLNGSFNPTVLGTHYTATVDVSLPPNVNIDVSGSGANLVWDAGTNSTAWDNGTSTNWINQGTSLLDVFYSGDSVVFNDNAVQTNVTIASGTIISPTSITVNSTRNYSITGSGQINGPVSIVKQNTGNLTLGTPNVNYSGTLQVQAGTLVIGNNAALGQDIGTAGAVSATVSSGATLDLHGDSVNSASISVAGPGVGNNGAIINSGADQIHAVRYLTLTGDTSLGGNAGRWDVRFSGNNNGQLNGNGNITKVGTNYLGLVTVNISSSLGNVDIQGGTFSLELNTLINSAGWAGDTTHSITIENGATLNLNTLTTTAPLGRNIIMANGSTIGSGGGNALNGSVSLTGNDTLNITAASALDTSGNISGSGNLIINGGGILAVQSANTYTGSTLLNAGSLSVNDSASIASSTNITVQNSAFIDASLRSDTDTNFAVASGQTFICGGAVNGNLSVASGAVVTPGTSFASIGVLTVTNGAALNGLTWMKLSATNSTSDRLLATNGIAYGGTLVVTNLSGTITNGQTFYLFATTNYTGSFSTLVLPSAAGLTWTNNLSVNGTLTAGVVTGPPPTPAITSFSLSGTNLVINGTNGVNGEQYHVLTTTNLAVPIADWTALPAGTFGGNTFSITNGLNSAAPQTFFRLRVP